MNANSRACFARQETRESDVSNRKLNAAAFQLFKSINYQLQQLHKARSCGYSCDLSLFCTSKELFGHPHFSSFGDLRFAHPESYSLIDSE